MPLENYRFSNEFIEWARRACYTCKSMEFAEDAVLWSERGGEARFYIRAVGDWFELARADRGASADFILAGKSLGTIERYLFDTFGADLRSAQRLPWLRVPTKAEELAVGYCIVEQTDEFLELIAPNGDTVARCRRGRLGTMNLVVLSHLYGAPITEIERTYLDPTGRPLFPQTAT